MMGILDVMMPCLYGEGAESAGYRLEREMAQRLERELHGITFVLQDMGQDVPFPATQSRLSSNAKSISEAEVSWIRRDKLIRALRLASLNERKFDIKQAYSSTCRWILDHQAYKAWNDQSKAHEHHRIFWISGNPGTGKSTIMKFIYQNCETHKADNEIVISYFFNARGSEYETTTRGMWSALLEQLFEQAPDLRLVLDKVNFPSRSQDEDLSWTAGLLCHAFGKAVMQLGRRPLRCFIDALDECNESQIREMLESMEELALNALDAEINILVCFASRHYPTLSLDVCQKMTLEAEKGHQDDLEKFVQMKLKTMKSKAAEKLRTQVLEKANGVFIWAVLVIPQLNVEIAAGRMHELEKTLRSIPQDLNELFRQIITRDNNRLEDMLLCFQWILFAMRPLKVDEFYFAMITGNVSESDGELFSRDPDVTEDDMKRLVTSSSKGLAEVTQSDPRVQFIHESVRDFLLKDRGLQRMWPQLGDDVRSASQARLTQCCLDYIHVDRREISAIPETLEPPFFASVIKQREQIEHRYPLLTYACNYVLSHGDQSNNAAMQNNLLNTFPKVLWIKITNLLATGVEQRHTMNASMLYLLAESNCPELIKRLYPKRPLIGPYGERYGCALFAALSKNSIEAAEALIQNGRPLDLTALKDDIATRSNITSDEHKRGFESRLDQTPFRWALECRHENVALALLDAVDFDPERERALPCPNGVMPWAIRNNSAALVEAILGIWPAFADVRENATTPLILASTLGHDESIQVLMQHSVEIDRQDYSGMTALAHAASAGHESTVRKLLEYGASVTSGRVDRAPVFCAVRQCHPEIVNILLQHEQALQTLIPDRAERDKHLREEATSKSNDAVTKILAGLLASN